MYFQLPLGNLFLPYLHSISFVGANVTPILYAYLLHWKPRLELDRMEALDLPWHDVIIRSSIRNISPIFFHIIDFIINKHSLVQSYHSIPRNVITLWSCLSFGIVGFIFEIIFPDTEDIQDLKGITAQNFIFRNRVFAALANSFACFLL